jgi:hypothetical protein
MLNGGPVPVFFAQNNAHDIGLIWSSQGDFAIAGKFCDLARLSWLSFLSTPHKPPNLTPNHANQRVNLQAYG